MKKQKLKSLLIFFIILSFVSISTICFAEDTDTEQTSEVTDDTPVLLTASDDETYDDESEYDYPDSYQLSDEELESKSETEASDLEEHSGDYSQVGTNIELNKIVDGNVFIFGSDVTISGQINGDLFVIATNSLEIVKGAAIYGNVYAYSPQITLAGIVYNLYALSENFTCEYDGMAALDLKVFAKNIDFSGYIERHVYLAASESLTLTKDACILGNLNYSAKADNVTISEDATIRGETFASDFVSTGSTNIFANLTVSFITALTFILVILLALLLVKPNLITNAAKNLTAKPWKTLGCGALAFIIIPILAIICFMINVFATLAIVICAIYFILLALSTVIVTIGLAKYLDNKIEKTKSNNSILAYVLIVGVVLWILTNIPGLGVLVSIVVGMFGLGTIVVSLLPGKKANVEENKEKVEEKKEIEENKETENNNEQTNDNKEN